MFFCFSAFHNPSPLEMPRFSEYNRPMAESGFPAISNKKLSSLTPLEQRISAEFALRVRERMGERILDIRIFGSRARGEAIADSDLDIWILLDKASLKEQNEISDIGTDLFLEMFLPFQISPRIMSQEQYAQLIGLERIFPAEIERDGIPI